jgi:hypothetical protein
MGGPEAEFLRLVKPEDNAFESLLTASTEPGLETRAMVSPGPKTNRALRLSPKRPT